MSQKQIMIDRLKQLISDIEHDDDNVHAIVIRTAPDDSGMLFAALGDDAMIDMLALNVFRIVIQRKVLERRQH